MAGISYRDFDLMIERVGDAYRAKVLSAPGGEGSTEFTIPFSDLELENFLLRVGRTRGGTRRINSPEMTAAKTFGGKLFDAVFAGDVGTCLRGSLDECDRDKAGLRLRLRLIGAPELCDLPWEYLYNPRLNQFLSLSIETPIVRYLDIPSRIQPIAVTPPLKILVVISDPRDYPKLDVEAEWRQLNEALRDLTAGGRAELTRAREASLAELQRTLRAGEYHILHFVGHGGFDPAADAGVLVFKGNDGNSHKVTGEQLGTILRDYRTRLRLVVLNACEGARSSKADPFAGTAQTLVQQGIPAVVAMQFEISDDAAITFAREFYGVIAEGFPVDASLAEARRAIFGEGNEVEWGTPVLYLRAPDGRIFDIAQGAPPVPRPMVERAPEPPRAPPPPEPVTPTPVAPTPAAPVPPPRAAEPVVKPAEPAVQSDAATLDAYRLFLRNSEARFRHAYYWSIGVVAWTGLAGVYCLQQIVSWNYSEREDALSTATGILAAFVALRLLTRPRSFEELLAQDDVPKSMISVLSHEPEFAKLAERRYREPVQFLRFGKKWLMVEPYIRYGLWMAIAIFIAVIGLAASH